ncbi:uncharacterized protein LOC127866006 [Dreissena polymorpha]|uniref:uncharacterized protein LOC127866006 n=1 Tax=Dreissena polymorpha TaxID=45954 RepID=UPI0022646D31|nr:uncharacterized protein LOC127866006 [Dreissena polymorpha]
MTPSNKLYALVPPCYLSDTAFAAGIQPLEQSTVTPQNTQYLVYAHNPGGFDFKSSGAVNAENTCGDSVSTVRETLIVNIISTAPLITNPWGSSDVDEDVSGTLTLKTLDFVTFDKSDATCSMTSADGGPFAVTGSLFIKNPVQVDSVVPDKPVGTA